MPTRAIRPTIVVLAGFVTATAIGGGLAMLAGVDCFPPAWLAGTPFADYTIPALLLAVVVGGSALVAAIAGMRSHRLCSSASSWPALAPCSGGAAAPECLPARTHLRAAGVHL